MATFRTHQITRTCDKKYADYHSYQKFLLVDFSERCCYCNIHRKTLEPLSFQIDHFVPKKCFEGKRDELLTQYDNLMLSCPKCNRAKSDQFEGDLMAPVLENRLFYNPEIVDYNTVFYRDDLGGISSNDPKGNDMIKRLKLYRKLHNYAWVLEKISNLIDTINRKIAVSDGEERKQLEEIRNRLGYKFYLMHAQFLVAYRE